jgi:hypothetical protein
MATLKTLRTYVEPKAVHAFRTHGQRTPSTEAALRATTAALSALVLPFCAHRALPWCVGACDRAAACVCGRAWRVRKSAALWRRAQRRLGA